ncbi:MAG: tRNA (guanine(46)-N(7))-methyltransferase TrmB [Alphaproteobacteria bacterium]|nr:tRNA (guanine(46)-N(7))-methyltransferase TrmB [Alphaproteobacteria bacterium]
MKTLIRSFGRIRGKPLSTRQQFLVDNLLPILIPAPATSHQPLILEIGFGAGEHLMHVAKNHPDHIIIGAEPFVNGVGSLLSQISMIKDKGLGISVNDIVLPEYKNIRIWNGDVRELLITNPQSLIPDFAFRKIYVLHPDPWPKARHEKRRLLQAEFIKELYEHLVAGGEIIIGTDHMDLLGWITEQINSIHDLRFTIHDNPPESGMNTIYKEKDMFGAQTTKYIVITKD